MISTTTTILRGAVCCGALALLACSNEPTTITIPTEGLATTRTLESGGVTRSYQMFVPSSVRSDVPARVIIALHPVPGNSGDMRGISGFDQIARLLETIMVYPNATLDWAEDCDCSSADAQGVDDVQFIRDLLDHVATTHAIDRSKVYLTGYSQGGRMVQNVACKMAGEISGVAVVAASMSRSLGGDCAPQGRVPFLMIHGTEDTVYPFLGSANSVAARDVASFWASVSGCSAEPTVRVLDDQNDGTTVNFEHFEDCDGGSEVDFYGVVEGGHTWPNPILFYPEASGLKTLEIDAAATIGVFFLRH